MGQDCPSDRLWLPPFFDLSSQLFSLSWLHSALPEGEELSIMSWGSTSPQERKADETEPQPAGWKEMLPTSQEDAEGRRDPLSSYPVTVACCHQALSPTPLAGPTSCPHSLGTLLPPGEKSLKEFELYTAEYIRADEPKQEKTGGVSPLSGKIQPVTGELMPRVREGLGEGDLDTIREAQRSE